MGVGIIGCGSGTGNSDSDSGLYRSTGTTNRKILQNRRFRIKYDVRAWLKSCTALNVVYERTPILDQNIDEIKQNLKDLLVENLSLEDVEPGEIEDDMPLFGDDGLGLDSLDGVEIVVMLQRHYGLDVKDMQKGREIFQSINTLADYVQKNTKQEL